MASKVTHITPRMQKKKHMKMIDNLRAECMARLGFLSFIPDKLNHIRPTITVEAFDFAKHPNGSDLS